MAGIHEYVTVSEAAAALGCARRTVYGYLKRGLLPYERRGAILIPLSDIRSFQPPKPGNPHLKRRN